MAPDRGDLRDGAHIALGDAAPADQREDDLKGQSSAWLKDFKNETGTTEISTLRKGGSV